MVQGVVADTGTGRNGGRATPTRAAGTGVLPGARGTGMTAITSRRVGDQGLDRDQRVHHIVTAETVITDAGGLVPAVGESHATHCTASRRSGRPLPVLILITHGHALSVP